jgi:hypothetical protein
MTAMFTTTDGAVDPTAAHDFALREQRARLKYDIVRMELDQRLEDLIRRAEIAQLKMKHNMLCPEERDDLTLEGEELLAEIELWKAYR